RSTLGQAIAPAARFLANLEDVEIGEHPVAQLARAGDPYVADLMPAGRVDDLRDRVIDRLRLDRIEPDRAEIGLLTGLDRADAIFPAERFRATECRGAQCRRGVERARIFGNGFGEQRGRAHLAEHVEIVVARAAVGADREIDAGALQLRGGTETR